MLTNPQIVEYVERAFSPYRCVAEIWDYDAKLRFRIFDGSEKALKSVESVTLDSVRSESELEALCETVRLSLWSASHAK